MNVVYAVADIPGQTILMNDPTLLRTEPTAQKDAAAFFTVKVGLDEVKGIVTKYRINKGYPILQDAIAGKIDQLGIAAVIPPGKRAMVVDLKKRPNFFEVIRAGDHVDIIGTYPSGETPTYTSTIVSDALVLAVDSSVDTLNVALRSAAVAGGQQTTQQPGKAPSPPPQPAQAQGQGQQQPQGPPPHNITLALSPKDAERVAVSNQAMLDIVLRPKSGMGLSSVEGAPSATQGTGATPTGVSGRSLSQPGGKTEVRTGTRSLTSLPRGTYLTDIAPTSVTDFLNKLKNTKPTKSILPPPPRRIKWTPNTGPQTPPWPPLPGLGKGGEGSGGTKPPVSTHPTYEVQVFKGGAQSTVEVKKPLGLSSL